MPRIEAENPFEGVEQAIAVRITGGVIDRRGEERAFVGAADAQQGVAKHRGRAIIVGRRKDQHDGTGIDRGEGFIELGAERLRQGKLIEVEDGDQPFRSGRKTTAEMLVVICNRCQQPLQIGTQLRLRVGLSLCCQKKIGVVDQTDKAVSLLTVV